MARTKRFSPELVMERVADTFVTNGYNGTSLSLLMDVSGLSKQSLYDTYGPKQAMYLQAVDCVVNRYNPVANEMAKAANGREALLLFFEQLLSDCVSGDTSRSGCIVSSGLLEGVDDLEIHDFLEKKWREVRGLLQQTIKQGQQDGSIRSTLPAAELASFFITVMSGLRVTGRALENKRQLKRILDIALLQLDG